MRRRWMQPDRIETRRLVLRRPAAADAARITELAGDWEVARWTAMIPHPYEPPMAESFLALVEHQRRTGAAWHYALTLAPDPELIGLISARLQGRPGTAELGYWLGRAWWGRGLMGEAAGALAAELRRAGCRRLRASALPDNLASIRIQERLGMTPAGRAIHAAPARASSVEVEIREAWLSPPPQPETGRAGARRRR